MAEYVFCAPELTTDPHSPIESVTWKDKAVPSGKDQSRLCGLIQKAIFSECALEIDEANSRKTEHLKHRGTFHFWRS